MFVIFHRRALKYCCFLDRQRKCIVNWLYWYTPQIVSSISTVHSGISDSSCWLYISQHLPWWTQICCASSWLRWKDHYSLVYRKYTSNLCGVKGNIITVWTVNTKLLLTESEGPRVMVNIKNQSLRFRVTFLSVFPKTLDCLERGHPWH